MTRQAGPPLRVGLAGLGNVGAGVAQVLRGNEGALLWRAGRKITIACVSARDPGKERGVDLSGIPFVHMDVGNVRHWPRMTRDQLAKIFPDGRTLHIPSDGNPLPGYALALADHERGVADRVFAERTDLVEAAVFAEEPGRC